MEFREDGNMAAVRGSRADLMLCSGEIGGWINRL